MSFDEEYPDSTIGRRIRRFKDELLYLDSSLAARWMKLDRQRKIMEELEIMEFLLGHMNETHVGKQRVREAIEKMTRKDTSGPYGSSRMSNYVFPNELLRELGINNYHGIEVKTDPTIPPDEVHIKQPDSVVKISRLGL